MSKQTRTTPSLTPRARAEIAVLNESLEPGYLMGVAWPRLLRDPRFADVGHALLEFANQTNPGRSAESIRSFENMVAAAALVGSALLEPQADS